MPCQYNTSARHTTHSRHHATHPHNKDSTNLNLYPVEQSTTAGRASAILPKANTRAADFPPQLPRTRMTSAAVGFPHPSLPLKLTRASLHYLDLSTLLSLASTSKPVLALLDSEAGVWKQ